MQTSVNITNPDEPNPVGDNRDREPDTYVIRKTAGTDDAEEHCYICFEGWQVGDGMVRLRCCPHWLHEGCLSRSVLNGQCPTCRIWLASLDPTMVLLGAASTGDVTKLKDLLERHTSTTARDYYGRTPLHVAVLSGHQEVVKKLLDYGVDISAVDSKGQTALHLAAQHYSLKILELLLVGGADVNARDGEDMTPLHFAYQKDVTEMIDFLLENGARREARANYGIMPEMLRPSSSYSESLRWISRF